MIDLCTLGTGGTMPLPDRALASLYVRVGGRAVLVDCGEGTQIGIQRLSWGIQCIDAILLTHYHADHCSGLPGMLLAITKARADSAAAHLRPDRAGARSRRAAGDCAVAELPHRTA